MSSERNLEREAAERQDGVGVFLSNNHIVVFFCFFFLFLITMMDQWSWEPDRIVKNKMTVSLTATLVR